MRESYLSKRNPDIRLLAPPKHPSASQPFRHQNRGNQHQLDHPTRTTLIFLNMSSTPSSSGDDSPPILPRFNDYVSHSRNPSASRSSSFASVSSISSLAGLLGNPRAPHDFRASSNSYASSSHSQPKLWFRSRSKFSSLIALVLLALLSISLIGNYKAWVAVEKMRLSPTDVGMADSPGQSIAVVTDGGTTGMSQAGRAIKLDEELRELTHLIVVAG